MKQPILELLKKTLTSKEMGKLKEICTALEKVKQTTHNKPQTWVFEYTAGGWNTVKADTKEKAMKQANDNVKIYNAFSDNKLTIAPNSFFLKRRNRKRYNELFNQIIL